ncbi:LCP family protein [Jiangella mangrovi]|uniref:LCP family protein required for cell wall assembly n=1 Tax=Jiangella mangrovi TaxID=1524084 RepID=A0A7W9GR69_9ACTN|nr:LCP family protein [Jiangella mangrovi]MBB5788392.1 LCP family protein required for cell wall assembly [Jiangella mangrovi]
MRPDGEAGMAAPGADGGARGTEIKVTTYQAGHVPGVSYRGGMAHSPRDDESAQAPAPAPAMAAPAGGTSVMPSDAYGPADTDGIGGPPATPPPTRRRREGAEPPARPKKRRSGAGRFFRWLLIILLVIAVALAALVWYVWGRIEKVDAIPEDHGSAVSDGRVFLLVGSDSREDLSRDEQSELGTGSTEGQRTDTIMLLSVPGGGARNALISIPRDSVVDIPGHGENRINAAFAFGGAPLLVETIEAATGVAIDDYVQIGFGGFAGIVDALGGVEMCLDEAVQDEQAHIDLPAGCQVLNGPDALGYARARHFDPTSDIGRVQRQRELISAIADKALSPGTLVNPIELTRTALAGGDALVLDEDTGPMDMFAFARGIGSVSSGSGDTITVPLGEIGNTVTWDSELAPELWAALQQGDEIPPAVLEAQP